MASRSGTVAKNRECVNGALCRVSTTVLLGSRSTTIYAVSSRSTTQVVPIALRQAQFLLHRLFYEKKKKVKTLYFSGSFVACDLKVGRYRRDVELMKCCEY